MNSRSPAARASRSRLRARWSDPPFGENAPGTSSRAARVRCRFTASAGSAHLGAGAGGGCLVILWVAGHIAVLLAGSAITLLCAIRDSTRPVAVPATTAVRATPRAALGMVLSFLAWISGRSRRGPRQWCSCGMYPAATSSRVTPAQRVDEGCCPPVLEDQDAGRRARLDH